MCTCQHVVAAHALCMPYSCAAAAADSGCVTLIELTDSLGCEAAPEVQSYDLRGPGGTCTAIQEAAGGLDMKATLS